MTHTNPEFLYELKIGIAALQRACYEVIGACNQIEYSIRLLDPAREQAAKALADAAVQTVEADHMNKVNSTFTGGSFTPAKKPVTTKGDPLAELAAQMSPQDREKLIAAMELKEKK